MVERFKHELLGSEVPHPLCDPLPRYRFIISAVAHNLSNKPASIQRKQKLGGLFRYVFIHVWLRLGFFVSNRMSVEFSRNTIIPGRKFDIAEEKVRVFEKKKPLILEKLSEARIDNNSNYGRKIGAKSSQNNSQRWIPRLLCDPSHQLRARIFKSIRRADFRKRLGKVRPIELQT